MSPGGWLTVPNDSTGSFDQRPGEDGPAEPNVFAASQASPPESSIDEADENDLDVLDVLDEEDAGSDGLGLAEASYLSTNGHSDDGDAMVNPALGEEDAEGRDEADTPTDGEGNE